MKIYSLPPSEGLRVVIAYQCNYCHDTESGEDLPENWLIHQDSHYCINCQDMCIGCFTIYSLKYSEDYFEHGFCENCQDKYLQEEKNETV